MAMNDWQIGLIGKLDGTKSKQQLNDDIEAIKKTLKELEIKAKLDPNQVKSLEGQLNNLKVNLTNVSISPASLTNMVNQINSALSGIKISNVNIGSGNATNIGQQIGNNIAQGVSSGVGKATTSVKSFSKLVDSMKSQKVELDTDGLIDDKKTLDAIKQTYSEFGQVKITNKVFDSGELKSFRVNIEQVNGDLKETRSFMMQLSNDGKSFVFPDDVIKGTEKYVQHLDTAKNITNATGDVLNEQKQKLAEQDKYYGKLEQATKEQLAIEEKRITAGEKQLEILDKQSKRRDSRISYNEGQIDKKGLTDISRVRDINDMVSAGNEKYDNAFAREIDKNITNLSKLKTKWQEQGVYVDEFKAKVEALEMSLNSIDSGDVKGLNSIRQQMEALSKEASTIADVNKIQLSTDITKIENDYKRFGIVSQEVENNLKELKIARENALKAEGTDRASAEIEKYNQKLAETKSSWKELQATQVSVNQRTSQMTEMQEWMRKNQRATKLCGDQVQKLIQECQTCDKVRFDQIKNEFKELQVEAGKAGKLGNTLFGGIIEEGKKFIQWTGVTGAIMTVSNKVREAVDELKDLDNILTEISKTSDLTEQQLKKLGDSAFDTASKYGRTASDYLTGVQEMYRAGFDNASEMAELSVLAQSAGDMETNSANDYLIATNAAYDYKGSVEELNKVLDSQNYITNNAAVSMQDMADATSEAASIASQYGVEVDELSALIAVAVSKTRESGSEVGTALKALLINLQDTTSKPIREAFEAVGISMTKMVNGSEQLKTPIELIKELSVAFNSLPEGDVKRANILNDIGGKHHANTLSAILQDLDSYNSMLELYNSNLADNSAYNEAMKSANNWSGTLNKLSNSFSDLIQNFANSDVIIGAINLVNDLVQALDKLGALGTIGLGATGLGIGQFIKNFA